MFDIFKTDPEPVSTHFEEDMMIVTAQRKYNSKQIERLIAFIRRHCCNLASVELTACNGTAVSCLSVTFSNATSVQVAQKRVLALATMYAKRITPREEPKPITSQQLSLF